MGAQPDPTATRKLLRPALILLSPLLVVACGFAALADEEFSSEERSHWSFQPIGEAPVPRVKAVDRVQNPIDAFLLEKLEAQGLEYSPEAGRRELIRRLSFDLIGLPPSPQEIDAFLADTAPDAYERLVDRLLESPHYGEHWARLWLDVVRYAETAGYNADPLRPNAWKYRDYVIRALNADKPYDRFVEEQIAGDELFPDDPQALIGSGYVLMWPDESNASNILLARQDALNDLTGNVGAVFLGLSVGCAQCHDHKFDPIRQRDFYRLQAFFSGVIRRDEAAVGTTEQLVEHERAVDAWLAESQPLRDELHRLEYEARIKAAGDRRMKFPEVVLAALDTPPESRTTMQRQLAFWSERQIEIKDADITKHLSDDEKQRRSQILKELGESKKRRPKPPAEIPGMIAGEIAAVPPPTYFLATGSYDKPRDEVTPGFLSVLFPPGEATADVSAPHERSSGRRSALARWLADPANPLVPRVIVNRLWQGHFGFGLIENGNDLGTQSAPPSHPELLDWLAKELIRGQWSLKHLHRLIVSSAAYRQSTRYEGLVANPLGATVDPGNRLYWHFPRRRLSGEALRDSLLAVSGKLNPAVLGPSVFPELPADYSRREAWKVSANPADRERRSIYIHAKRNLPYPLLEAFDLPDMHESCARRVQTTVAPQALLLINSGLVLDFAEALAGRLLVDNPQADAEPAIRGAYRLAYGRDPDSEELAAATRFLADQSRLVSERLSAGEQVALPRSFPKFLDPSRAAALVDFCHALLNANEFVYVD